MLRLETGLGPTSADVREVEPTTRQQRQRQAGPQDLPAAFTEGTIEFEEWGHGVHLGFIPLDSTHDEADDGGCNLPIVMTRRPGGRFAPRSWRDS